jgi:hypothetical protein
MIIGMNDFFQELIGVAMKKNLLIVLVLFYWHSAVASLSIEGSWQIVSYQVVGYPLMSQNEMKNWVGKVADFTPQKKAILRGDETVQECPNFNEQVTTVETEGYFLVGYKINPHRLGIVEEKIQLVTLTCQTDSWLGKERGVVIISDEQMLGNWDGTIFFFLKQTESYSGRGGSKTLLITPQSVGLLDPNSDFDKKTIKRALPNGYTVKEMSENSHSVSHFEIFREKKLKLAVYPDSALQKIASIHIFDDRALAPAQAKLGITHAQVFRSTEKLIDCQAGINGRTGETLCSFKQMSSIQYVFKPTQDGNISPIDALNQAKLSEIIWTADMSLIVETPPSSSIGDQ